MVYLNIRNVHNKICDAFSFSEIKRTFLLFLNDISN